MLTHSENLMPHLKKRIRRTRKVVIVKKFEIYSYFTRHKLVEITTTCNTYTEERLMTTGRTTVVDLENFSNGTTDHLI